MSAKRLRIAAFLVLANYVLALTVGGSFHLHGDASCGRGNGRCFSLSGKLTAPRADHPSDGAGCCAPHDPATEGTLVASRQFEKCPVCQFLAQKPVPTRPVEAGACTELVDGWVPVRPVRPVDHLSSAHPIRGPPAVA